MSNILTYNASSADNHAGKIQYNGSFDEKSLAYLFGVYLGDGCCSRTANHYCFSILSEDRDVIERTKEIVNLSLNKNYPLTYLKPNKTNLYRFRSWNKWLFEMLKSETANKTKIPQIIINSKIGIIAEFVAGLMDTDGYISTGKTRLGQQRFSLGFINSGEWLDPFIILLQFLEVKVGKKILKKKYRSKDEKDCFQININLRSFVEAGLYFNCQRKQQILDKYKSSVRYQSY